MAVEITTDPSAVVAFAAIALWTKGAIMSLGQVVIRVATRRYARLEDARMMGREPASEDSRIERLARAWQNEHENTPLFLALSFAYVLAAAPATGFEILCATYVTARYVQTWAQFQLWQPLRTIAYLVGLGAAAVLAAQLTVHLTGIAS
jgi:uncharacterized MAPEG superfamily protein